jgi:adenine phosphoribosyltransferase
VGKKEASLIAVSSSTRDHIHAVLQRYPNFPKRGINFVDFFSLFKSPSLVNEILEAKCDAIKDLDIQGVVGIDSRGFIFGILISSKLGLPFQACRKSGKLPGSCAKVSYELEYGSASMEMQESVLPKSSRVLIVDDLLATGGTLGAAVKLAQTLGLEVVGCLVTIKLPFLGGASKVGAPVWTLIKEN